MTKTKKAALFSTGALVGLGVWWLMKRGNGDNPWILKSARATKQKHSFIGIPTSGTPSTRLMTLSNKTFVAQMRLPRKPSRSNHVQPRPNLSGGLPGSRIHGNPSFLYRSCTKLLRGLYERAVAHAYIIRNPEKVVQSVQLRSHPRIPRDARSTRSPVFPKRATSTRRWTCREFR